MLSEEKINEICNYYCGDNAKKLNKIVAKMLSSYKDARYLEDFYGEANEIVWKCAKHFDNEMGIPFEPWLRQCLAKKLATYSRDMLKRDKRRINAETISLDAPIETNNGEMSRHEVVSYEQTLICSEDKLSEKRWDPYFRRLTPTQRRVAKLISEGKSYNEIQISLNMSRAEFNKHMSVLQWKENTKHIKDIKIKENYIMVGGYEE